MPIWKTLHNLDHIDYSFNHVASNFTLPINTQDSYSQSIYMFAIIPIAVGVLILMLTLILQCIKGCNCCCFNNVTRTSTIAKYSKYIRIGFIVTGLCLIGSCFYLLYRLNQTVTTTCVHLDTYHTAFNKPMKRVDNIHNNLTNIARELKNISDSPDTLNVSGQSVTMDINDYMNAESVIKGTTETATAVNKTKHKIQKSIPKLKTQKNVQQYQQSAVYGANGLFGFCALVLFMSLIVTAVGTDKPTCNGCAIFIQVLLTITLLIMIIFASIQFAASVAISDVCDNPKQTAIDVMNKFVRPNDTFTDTMEYYIFCDKKHSSNEIFQILDETKNEIIKFKNYTHNIEQHIVNKEKQYGFSYSKKTKIKVVSKNVNNIEKEIPQLKSLLKCDRMAGKINQVETDVCQHVTGSLYNLYVVMFVTILLLIASSCLFVCTSSKQNANHYTAWGTADFSV